MAQSASLINSAGLWLTPPLQRTNSMPAGQRWPITIVSWPAPDGSRRGSAPTATTAASSPATILGWQT